MSQWFSGVGPLTPSSPAQAATLILEGTIKEHEANHPSKPCQKNSTRQSDTNHETKYKSAYPLILTNPSGTVCHLCFFPSGVHRQFFTCYQLYRHQVLLEHGLVAFAFSSSRNELENQPRLQVFENGSNIAHANLKEKVSCIGLESRDRIALGHDAHVGIYDRQHDTFVKTERIMMKGHSPVVAKFSGEVLLIGTKLGGVFGYNMRKGQFSWTFQAEGRGRVHDLQMKKGMVYVSGTGGLWMWDMRGTDKIRRQFLGHRNRDKRIEFDTSTELGLLAAGGCDGVVRLWNCRSGEDPMGDVKIPGGTPASVRFVRETWDGQETLGLWIATKRRLYICMVEPNHPLDMRDVAQALPTT